MTRKERDGDENQVQTRTFYSLWNPLDRDSWRGKDAKDILKYVQLRQEQKIVHVPETGRTLKKQDWQEINNNFWVENEAGWITALNVCYV